MSVARFCAMLPSSKLPATEKEWFPRWIRRYASSCGVAAGDVAVSERDVIAFLRSLREHGTPAWQRLQAVKAVESYRALVLRDESPDLRHKALPTERAYVGWLLRFIQHYGSPDLVRFGAAEIKAFLTDLAVRGNATAGTQNQAKRALLFLYSTVLGREREFLDVARATKSPRLPVVLSCGGVFLPHALERKYPQACREFGWQWLFPSLQLARDPRSGAVRRHHRRARLKRAATG